MLKDWRPWNVLEQEKRQLRRYMIEVYRILHGMKKVDRGNFFFLSYITRTQRHVENLMGDRWQTDRRKYFFTQHEIEWCKAASIDGFIGV